MEMVEALYETSAALSPCSTWISFPAPLAKISDSLVFAYRPCYETMALFSAPISAMEELLSVTTALWVTSAVFPEPSWITAE